MAILVFVAIGIAQSIWNTYRLRDQLTVEGDFYTSIRLTMAIMERDVTHLFSPQLLLPNPQERLSPEDILNLQTITRSDIERPSEYYGAIISKTGIRTARFQGTSNRISFISAAHRRIYKESPESIFAKVKYALEDDPKSIAGGPKVLVKTQNSNPFDVEDDERDESIKRFPLLPGVEEIKFRFFHTEKGTWLEQWDSDRAETKNIFPGIIEVSFRVIGADQLKFTGQYHFKTEIPIDGIRGTF